MIPDFPGLTDFVRNEENCLTYTAGDISDLVSKVDGLLGDDSRRHALGVANREMAKRFTRAGDVYELIVGA